MFVTFLQDGMIPGGPLYVFCIEMGYTGEKLAEILDQKLQKIEKINKFELNGSFRGAFATQLGSFKAKKFACFEYDNRFWPRPHIWPVLKDPDFSKNQDFFQIFRAYADTKYTLPHSKTWLQTSLNKLILATRGDEFPTQIYQKHSMKSYEGV